MAAFVTKVVVLMVVVASLLLLKQTSSVDAVDIVYYNENGCDGTPAGGCYSVAPGTCCYDIAGAASVEIVNLLSGESGSIYTGGGCATDIANLVGPSAGECYYNDAFSGALWDYNTPN